MASKLKKGDKVVVINTNRATIKTNPGVSDKTSSEPITKGR